MLSASTAGSSPPFCRLASSVASAGCLLIAGCGGSSAPTKPVAERVCDGAHGAATALLGYPVGAHIVERDPANLECALTGRRLRVRIVSQASPQAYMAFDIVTSHQSQVFGPGIHEPGQIPRAISVTGAVVAVWIPAQREVVATSGSPTHGGAYVTVTVTGRSARGPAALALARAIARATFAAHPDAPS